MPQPHQPRPGDYPDRMLPGNYECLTMQINATVYPRAGTIRAVVIIRDPNSGVEMDRTILHTQPMEGGIGHFRAAVATRLQHMLYLSGLNDEGRRIPAPDL